MSQRLQSSILHGSEPTSSDVEEDNLNEDLNEFERNILINEELNINRSQQINSSFGINNTKPLHNRRTANATQDSGIVISVN